MELKREDLNKILKVRAFLIESFGKCKDCRLNKNAIMREIDHVEVLQKSIVEIDDFLKKYVEFD